MHTVDNKHTHGTGIVIIIIVIYYLLNKHSVQYAETYRKCTLKTHKDNEMSLIS